MLPIIELIDKNGPISVAKFMEIALYHPTQGYYIKQNPLGINGDFITSPEISQLFGEIIGIYVINAWLNLGSPEKFNLIELGPGKGTLMLDLLRASKHVDAFNKGAQIHLVESNDYLKSVQQNTLKNFNVTWHRDLYSIQNDTPIIIIANEFFDCLPINQYIKVQNQWHERLIAFNNNEFYFTQSNTPYSIGTHHNAKEGDIVEICYPALEVIEHISKILKKFSGYALIIDYGYYYDPLNRSIYGDTFQAIRKHKYHSVFKNIGKTDLTAHVDFNNLKQTALENDMNVNGPFSQKQFLIDWGINIRSEMLKAKATSKEKHEINLALTRLTKEMGELFKVIEISSKQS